MSLDEKENCNWGLYKKPKYIISICLELVIRQHGNIFYLIPKYNDKT